jgi:hypothetical protein
MSAETANTTTGQTSDGKPAGQNGTACPPTGQASRSERAEQIVDNMSRGVSDFASKCGNGVGRLFSWVKDEVGSIWDEAQSVRRGEKPTPADTGAAKEQPR